MGRSYGDVGLPATGGVAVQTRWFDRFLDFDAEAGTITAEAGVTLEQIVDLCLPRGWFLPVTPGTRFISVGGAIASNVHGKNHHHAGAIVNFIESLELLSEGGVLGCSRTVNPDVFFATVGGYGLTGLILRATLRLRRVDSSLIEAKFVKASCLEEAIEIDFSSGNDYEYSVTWLDALAGVRNLGRGLVMLGNHAEAERLPAPLRRHGLENRWSPTFRAPPVFPGWVLNTASNKMLNTAYGNRFIGREKKAFVGLESWFYPLDRVLDWNRFYGRHGFVEFQCSLPENSAQAGMRVLLSRIRKAGLGSFLAVYKRIGHDGVTLPFAVPGLTLAMDFGLRRPEVLPLLDELDRVVIDHGGRIYLSKDARMKPATFRQMYPEYETWREVVRKVSPRGIFRSGMSERLGL